MASTFGRDLRDGRKGKGIVLRIIEDEIARASDPDYISALEEEHSEIKALPLSSFMNLKALMESMARNAIYRAREKVGRLASA